MWLALHKLLCCLGALVIGLGPTGAAVLANSLHAPLCACAGCGADGAPASCCGAPGIEGDGPALIATPADCPCVIVPASPDSGQAVAPRTSEARSGLRAELERCQRAVELSWSTAPLLALDASSDDAAQNHCAEHGPPGARRAHGAARAAALGSLLL